MSVPILSQVTDSSFESEVLRATGPVIVGFWSPWSGAARLISATVRELADRYRDQIKCVYLNVDEDPRVPSTYMVHTLPTLLLFVNGEVEARLDGAQPKAVIESFFADRHDN